MGEPLLGLPKLVVLSALAQAEVDAAANDGNGAEDDEEGDEPTTLTPTLTLTR